MDYIDAHAHIYPDAIAEKAAMSIGEFYEMDMNLDGRLDTLRDYGTKAGIEKHMVHGVAITPNRVEGINNYLIRMVQEHPDWLIAFGAIHPDLPDVRAEIHRIKEAGLSGVKIHADFQKVCLDSEGVIQIFRALAEENMPAMLHMGDFRHPYSQPQRLQTALQAVPDVKVIGAHFGGWSVWQEAWKILADIENVWVDTSSSLYSMTPEEGAALVRRYQPGHVFFATDYPMWNPIEERARFEALPLTAQEREDIGRHNIEAFLQQF